MVKIRIKKFYFGSIVKYTVMILASVVSIYPVLWMIITSLKNQGQYLEDKLLISIPFYFENFNLALRGGKFFLWFLNSAVLTFGSVILCTVIAILAAFAFSTMHFKGKRFLKDIVITLMVIPVVVMIVPLYTLYSQLNIISTYGGLILIYAGVCIPFSVYLLNSFFSTIPVQLYEAAVIDGASRIGILTRIVLPLSGPPIATLIITNGIWVWNELLLALVFLPSDKMKTVMVGLTVFKSRYNIDIPVTMAGLFLSTIPMIVLYIVFQKFFIKGLTSGSVKG